MYDMLRCAWPRAWSNVSTQAPFIPRDRPGRTMTSRDTERQTHRSRSAQKTPETSRAKSAGRARGRHVPPHSPLLPYQAHARSLARLVSPLRSVRFLISYPVSLPPPPATPPPTDRAPRTHAQYAHRRAHGRTDSLAAHGRRRPRRPSPPHLLLRIHLQELQAVSATAAEADAAAVRRSTADGARRGGSAPATGGPPAPGRAGGGRRAGHHRRNVRRAAAPDHHGRPLRLHALGGLPRLAVAPRPHRAGRDQRAQEAAQTGRRRRRRRRRGLRLPAPSSRRQVANRDQDRRAHRGAEEAGEGVVQGQALQRGVDPAGAGRHGVRRRRAQHLAPHREALSRPAPVRRRGHHRALGGGRGACPGDAEGERDRQEPAHRAQHHQRPALHLADPHGARHRPQGLRVHQMAMSSYRTIPLGSRLVHRHPARFFV